MAIEEAALEVPVHEHEEHRHKKLVIIASSGDLDKAWAQMIIATAGAAMEMETTIFFTFWGLFSLVKENVRVTGENWMQKMVAMMDHPGMQHLKLGKMNFVGAGPAMMKKLAREHSVASPGELLQMAVDMGVKLVPCQMTMDMLGLKREDMIDGVGEPMGAAGMLLEAQDAVTLFV
ncbi:MAG TPA: DsrE/DsrF/DrsH-like family protein [Actinomycetota bacterium]|jgi:peroxiredoxin family protein|nr:DsrE/DsrF/DrsH-like family protein [Actinomycetota bacterium]